MAHGPFGQKNISMDCHSENRKVWDGRWQYNPFSESFSGARREMARPLYETYPFSQKIQSIDNMLVLIAQVLKNHIHQALHIRIRLFHIS